MWTNADGHLTVFHSFANANSIINMKSTIIATLGLLAMALPASAGYVLNPKAYAREYCNSKGTGMGTRSCSRACRKGIIGSRLPVEVMHEGGKTDADVVVAFAAAKYRCPDY